MPPKSDKPRDRDGAKARRPPERESSPAATGQKLNLGCGGLLAAMGVLAALAVLLPHQPRKPEPEATAAKPARTPAVTKTEPAKPPAPAARPANPESRPKSGAATKPAAVNKAPSTSEPPPPPRKKAPEPPEKPLAAVVANDPWSGAVPQVERYLKRTLYDAASLETLAWGPVAATAQGYRVECTYRAKNLFGIYATQSRVFLLNRQGEVYEVRNKKEAKARQ